MLIIEGPSDAAVEHVIDFGGNAESENPATVLIEPMTAAEYRREEAGTSIMPKGSRKKVSAHGFAHRLRIRVLRKRVKEIRNLHCQMVRGGPVVEIETAEQLVTSAVMPDEILDDIFEAIIKQSRISTGEEGNSQLPSDSSEPKEPIETAEHGSGVALVAEGRAM